MFVQNLIKLSAAVHVWWVIVSTKKQKKLSDDAESNTAFASAGISVTTALPRVSRHYNHYIIYSNAVSD